MLAQVLDVEKLLQYQFAECLASAKINLIEEWRRTIEKLSV